MKPDEKIYTTLLERYDLKAEECLFIDDRQNNLDTAKRLHMDTFLFNGNAKDLRDHLNKHIW